MEDNVKIGEEIFKFQYDNTLSLPHDNELIFSDAFKFQYDNTLSYILPISMRKEII